MRSYRDWRFRNGDSPCEVVISAGEVVILKQPLAPLALLRAPPDFAINTSDRLIVHFVGASEHTSVETVVTDDNGHDYLEGHTPNAVEVFPLEVAV